MGRSMAAGGVFMILGRAAILPAGLLTAIFLARTLGPADFGIYNVALSVIVWARMTISMLLNRASIKLISESADWQPLAIALIHIQLLLGTVAGVVAFLASPVLAIGLGEAALEPVLRVFAIIIPISTLAQAYRNTLNGRRAFRRSALLPVVAETSRFLLVLLLVGLGLGLMGAAWAALGAACAELWFALRSLRLRLWQRGTVPGKQFLRYSVPLFLDTLAKRLHKRVDLWAVQGLAGATAAGHYSVALSVNTVGNVFSHALSPVILATVSEAWALGQKDAARALIRQSLRLTLWLLPFAALGAGAAPALIVLVFGDAYLPAAPLLAWLSFSAVALVIMSVTAAIFAAAGRPGTAFAFNVPLLILALVGYLVLVPRLGAIGAAATTTTTAWGVALATMAGVHRFCQAGPGRGTIARIAVTSAIAYALARAWQAPAGWVIPQLLALCGGVLLLLFALREATADDLAFALSLLRRRPDAQRAWESELP
jgi:O-antigen/teichoic acid export membrane protein